MRRATIRYVNPGEVGDDGKHTVDRLTDRVVRSLVRLFNVQDTTWREEMKVVQDLVSKLAPAASDPSNEAVATKPENCDHCCSAHCSVFGHRGRKTSPTITVDSNQFELGDLILDNDGLVEDEVLDVVANSPPDSFLGSIGVLGIDLGLAD